MFNTPTLQIKNKIYFVTLCNNIKKHYPFLGSVNIKYIIYDYISTNYNSNEANHDILGFIDKDAEKYYSYPKDPNGDLKQRNNISNTILDEDDQY